MLGIADTTEWGTLESNLGISNERLQELADYVYRHRNDSLTDFIDLLTADRDKGFTQTERMYLAFKTGYAIGKYHEEKVQAVQQQAVPTMPKLAFLLFRKDGSCTIIRDGEQR